LTKTKVFRGFFSVGVGNPAVVNVSNLDPLSICIGLRPVSGRRKSAEKSKKFKSEKFVEAMKLYFKMLGVAKIRMYEIFCLPLQINLKTFYMDPAPQILNTRFDPQTIDP
jgi:hypothetical protein